MFSSELITSLTDLTSLTGTETEANIIALCEQAQTAYGQVAAVCVYPHYLAIAQPLLANTGIKLATVVNFPSGKIPLAASLATIAEAINNNADEIDLVLPYYLLIEQQYQKVTDYLQAVRQACKNQCLKVIIESGELNSEQIKTACELVIEAKADFIKTSTGKTKQGASLMAAEIILNSIKTQRSSAGIKVS